MPALLFHQARDCGAHTGGMPVEDYEVVRADFEGPHSAAAWETYGVWRRSAWRARIPGGCCFGGMTKKKKKLSE